MNFAKWLQNELNKRGWSQRDLVNHIQAGGYKISRSQITHILKSDIQASGEVCISIAYGLGISREEVFRARGWLLPKPDDPFGPEIDRPGFSIGLDRVAGASDEDTEPVSWNVHPAFEFRWRLLDPCDRL